MIFGVFAGVAVRAFPQGHIHTAGCEVPCEEADGGCESSHASTDHSEAPENSDDSEPAEDSHHHHLCAQASPLAVDDATSGRLPVLRFFLANVQADGCLMPESPVFELDTPPLI